VPKYRIYLLNDADCIRGKLEADCPDDQAAFSRAAAHLDRHQTADVLRGALLLRRLRRAGGFAGEADR
jgi:hypothetical protein